MKHGCCNDKACTKDTCMELPGGVTCEACRHFPRCNGIYGMKADSTNCDFFPRRFVNKGDSK